MIIILTTAATVYCITISVSLVCCYLQIFVIF